MRMPFPDPSMLLPAPSPSSPFGKGSKAAKAGTRDVGPSGPCRRFLVWKPAAVRSAPGRDRAEACVIGGFAEKASFTDSFTGCSAPAGSSRAVRSGTGHGDALQQFGELHREVDSLADLTCALGVGAGRSEPFELGKEQIEAV